MYCNSCRRRGRCKEICPELQKHLKKDIEVARIDVLECELGINIERVVGKGEWPEGGVVLDTKDWVYLMKKKPNLTLLQKRYVFLYYWQRINFKVIGKRYNISKQAVWESVVAGKHKIINTLTKT